MLVTLRPLKNAKHLDGLATLIHGLWRRDDEENAYLTTDTAARVQMMDADLQPYFPE